MIECVLIIPLYANDGIAYAYRSVQLPFLPTIGLTIVLTEKEASCGEDWSTVHHIIWNPYTSILEVTLWDSDGWEEVADAIEYYSPEWTIK